MSQHNSRPSTALMTVPDRLADEFAQQIFEWQHMLGQPPVRMYLAMLGDDGLVLESVDSQAVSASESYFAIVTSTNRIIGVIRDGALDAEPHRIPPARTICTFFRAAKA